MSITKSVAQNSTSAQNISAAALPKKEEAKAQTSPINKEFTPYSASAPVINKNFKMNYGCNCSENKHEIPRTDEIADYKLSNFSSTGKSPYLKKYQAMQAAAAYKEIQDLKLE